MLRPALYFLDIHLVNFIYSNACFPYFDNTTFEMKFEHCSKNRRFSSISKLFTESSSMTQSIKFEEVPATGYSIFKNFRRVGLRVSSPSMDDI